MILFLSTNFAVILVLSISARILGIDRFLTANGLNMGMLLAFAALIFGGSFFITSIVFEILFGVLTGIVVMYFSRKREYRADAVASLESP